MAWRISSTTAALVPFVPALTGLVISIWRFRVRDQLGGLAIGMTGFALLIVLAMWLDRRTSP